MSPIKEAATSDAGRSSRIPACTYRVSAEIRSPFAIACRISALGLRRPRSICDRYGMETPASPAALRRESFALSRWSLMKLPTFRTFTTQTLPYPYNTCKRYEQRQLMGGGLGPAALCLPGQREVSHHAADRPSAPQHVGPGERGQALDLVVVQHVEEAKRSDQRRPGRPGRDRKSTRLNSSHI